MIELPDFSKTYDYENYFYWTCVNQRIDKFIAHYELYKMSKDVEGAIVECGVFKGASLIRFATFRHLLSNPDTKKIIGFDSFADFPQSDFEPDKKMRDKFVDESGGRSISIEQLLHVLKFKDCDKNIELVAGDITETIPEYIKKNPELKISLLNLDVDIYEPSVTILEHLYPRLQTGGILILDDYNVYPGETKAVDEYFKNKKVNIKKFSLNKAPSYLVKK
ncbi:MAG: TylF/MycF family methyltransferase [Bacteroidota bacterium]|nr:TylF/MycF family methyltransferase [Bacteroidota bacterium]